jgi:hypothetical protein
MAEYRRNKRSKHNRTLRDGDLASFEAVTHIEVEVPTRSGTITKQVKVPLLPVPDNETLPPTTMPYEFDTNYIPLEPDPVPQANKRKVGGKQ